MSRLLQAKEEILLLLREVVGPEVLLIADQLGAPPNPAMGDLAFGCFPLAQQWKKSPAGVADDLAGVLGYKLQATREGSLLASVDAVGPYLNFRLHIGALAQQTINDISSGGVQYGTRQAGTFSGRLSIDSFLETRLEAIRNAVPGRSLAHQVSNLARGTARAVRSGTAARIRSIEKPAPLVMVEIGALNTHKEIHVGHVRNIVLGRTVVSLRRALGEQVVTASYPGDSGAHVAKTLWALEKFHAGETPPENKGRYLGQIYTEATTYLDKHPEAKEEVSAVLQKMESGDKHYTALWKRTRAWSLEEIQNVFRELGVPIRRYYFESEVEAPGKKFVLDLLKKGIAKRSQGAIIIDFDDDTLGAFLVLKSDGTTLYATKDLALAQKKFAQYPLDRSIVVVDNRQSLYFRQLFATLRKIGFEKPMVHVGYEFVTLKGGAMSSRKGNIITYEDLRDEMIAKATEETAQRHAGWSKKKITETARGIAFGAMTISMLKQDNDRQIVFDMDEALSFEGFTGPYLQYTLARVQGIARKGGRGKKVSREATFATPEERQLVLDLARYPEVVEEAAENYRPAKLVASLFELAKHFAEFYERVPVLKAPPVERAARLALVAAVGTVLESGFRLLGVPVLKEM
jgi:arginyl-tRNA synthetase